MLLFEYQYPSVSDSLVAAWVLPHNVCDSLVDEFNKNSDKHILKNSAQGNFRELQSNFLSPELDRSYSLFLHQAFDHYVKKFNHVQDSSEKWFLSKPYSIRKYDPHTNFTEWECDSTGPQKNRYLRNLCFMTYLHNLENKGGREFLHQKIYSNPRKGLTLIWPAGWTHMHREIPSDEEKYMVVGWTAFNNRI